MSDAKLHGLHLLHLRPDPLQLAAWAARHRLLDRSGDLGYALHALLRAAFGAHTPRSFRYIDAEQGLLAYTDLNSSAIQELAALAAPDVAAALGLGATERHGGFTVRPFPTSWSIGHVLGFEVRIRPVIRQGQTGQERDAFLAALDAAGGATVDRGQVYCQWLNEHLARQGGAQVQEMRMEQFRILNVMRKTQKGEMDEARRQRAVGGPDALLLGQLRVREPDAFAELIARGIGRHRAFGFGLLLLRPAGR
jgi:CRISPR system Cascade subunit CasE